jgi:hypothetical protein
MFGMSADYHDLNAGALRNSPKNLSAPALTWHLAFWTGKQSSGEIGDSSNDGAIKLTVDSFLLALCRSLKDAGVDVKILPSIGTHSLLFYTVVDRLQFTKVDKTNLPRRQDEIFQSTVRGVAIKFKWMEVDITIRCEVHPEFFAITHYAEFAKEREKPPYSSDESLNANLTAMLLYLNDNSSIDVNALRSHFFRDIWDLIYEDLTKFDVVDHVCKEPWFSRVFVDFRGIILSEKVVKIPYADEQLHGREPLQWGERAKDILMPVLKIPRTDRYRNYECVVNYVLDGRALFMSTLAPQLAEGVNDERIPTEYIVYAHQHDSKGGIVVNKWELGRLINQIHILGTLQLAALKDVKRLHEAGSRLSELDEITQAARERIAESSRTAMELIKDSHGRINMMTRRFLRDTSCGLSYRIEQSRYYVAVFHSFLKFLRIKRLEGDQPYDEFIERRLGAEFNFIDRLGKRYERAMNNITMLDQNYIAMNAAEVENETHKTEQSIEKIQEWGEFALLAALVPYYITHLLEFLVKDQYVPEIALVVWAIFVAGALYRILNKKGRVAIIAPILFLLFLGAAVFVVAKAMPQLAGYFRLGASDNPKEKEIATPAVGRAAPSEGPPSNEGTPSSGGAKAN